MFDGETKISTGKQQKQGGETALNSNLTWKYISLAGHPFTSVGQRFSGVVTEGCYYWPQNVTSHNMLHSLRQTA